MGRVAGIFALKVEDLAAYVRLREMARVRHPGVEDGRDSVAPYVETRELSGYSVRLVDNSRSFSIRSRIGWGPEFTKAVREMRKEDEKRQPQTFWLVYSYHSIESGLDAWDFKARSILPGVTLLGEGDVLPWAGSVLQDGVTVQAPASRPSEVPIWLAQTIGKPRSRKVMAAAREQHEATLRMENARLIAAEAQLRILEEEARAKAEEDRARAERILAEHMDNG